MFESKWDKWKKEQNPATIAWLDAQAKEDNKLIIAVAIPMLGIGMLIGFLFGLGV